jgi:hypothetical protein
MLAYRIRLALSNSAMVRYSDFDVVPVWENESQLI